jgi:hypothetical protein
MKFEPTARELALREYRKLYEKSYRYYLERNNHMETEYNRMCRGACRICLAIGFTTDDIAHVEELTRRIVDLEEEKQLQNA